MVKHIHLIGIGGIGMSAVAQLLLKKETYRITGCDVKENQLIRNLREAGICVWVGHNIRHLEAVDTVVYSTAIPQDTPEIQTKLQHLKTIFGKRKVAFDCKDQSLTNYHLKLLATLFKDNLVGLNLCHCNKLTDKGLKILENLPYLTTLNLNFCYQLTDGALQYVAKIKSLKTLRFGGNQMLSSGLQIPGFRKDIRVLERMLNRYIWPLTVVGGLAVGLLAAIADVSGALASGTGILLTVMIVYRLYEEIAQQHMMDMNPAMRKFITG